MEKPTESRNGQEMGARLGLLRKTSFKAGLSSTSVRFHVLDLADCLVAQCLKITGVLSSEEA